MKYVLYRAGKSIKKDIKKHELIGVYFGDSINEVESQMIKDVSDDLSLNPEYSHFRTDAYAPERIEHIKSSRYDYVISGIVYPNLGKNILVEYGIVEIPSKDGD